MTAPTVEQQAGKVDQPEHTGGMVALMPTAEDAAKLAVDGGDPAEQLHLTLAYLGDDVTDWDDEIVAAVHEVARKLTDLAATEDDDQPVPADGHDYRGPGQRGPLTLTVFSHSHFNPNGGPDDQEPCMVYQFSGEGDLNRVEALHSDVCWQVKEAIGEVNFPEQHAKFQPHVTAGYNLPPDSLSYTGPVTFDRLRVALADAVTDYPLGGGSMDEVTAAVARTKGGSVSSEAREKARKSGHAMPDGSFPIEDGADLDNAIQSVGRAKDLGAARRHIINQAKRLGLESKIPDSWNADGSVTASAEVDEEWRESITAAATALLDKLGQDDAYRTAPIIFFSPESLAVADEVIEPPLDDELTAAATIEELPSVEFFERPDKLQRGTGHVVDGRHVYGYLAPWDVPHIGIDGRSFYAPRSNSNYRWFHTKTARARGRDGSEERVKIGHLTFHSGHAPKSLGADHAAASAHYDNTGWRGAKVRVGEDDYGIWYSGVLVSGLDGARLEEFEESDTSGDWRRIMGNLELVAAHCVNVGGYPKIDLSIAASGEPLALVASARAWGNPSALVDVDAIAAAVVTEMGRRTMLTRRRDSLLAAMDDSAERMSTLLDELDEDLGADEIAIVDGMPAPTATEIGEASTALVAAAGRRGKNWLEQTGTGHLPRYIKRISKHLRRKGMAESHAIAVAVNAAKKMCASGDVNFPGKQSVNAGSRAEACAAVAEWESKKAQARAT